MVEGDRAKRRLAAIVAADVAGFSRLVGADEEGTLARLKALRRELIDPRIAEHSGRIVKTTGDGLLLEFGSAVDAVRCVVDIQRAMTAREGGLAENKRLQFRIGVNVGDIVIDGEDILGDGVNVAARLEQLAEPGEIWVSRVVRDQVRDKLAFAFDDMGEREVKNIARPIKVHRVRYDGDLSVQAGDSALSSIGKTVSSERSRRLLLFAAAASLIVATTIGAWLVLQPGSGSDRNEIGGAHASVAVLPFENLSGDPQQEYFSNGLTEELLTELARVQGLFVPAGNSSGRYKGSSIDLQQVGRELGVRYAVKGSVQKSGDRVRVTAQLVAISGGSNVWAERYDRPLKDIFAVQDEITAAIATRLVAQIKNQDLVAAKRKPTERLDAYDLYLQARELMSSAEGASKARALFERAVILDPNYADAYGGLAWVYANGFTFGWGDVTGPPALDKAIEFGRRSLELDPVNAIGASRLAQAYTFRGQLDEAEAIVTRAYAANPNNVDVIYRLGITFGFQGRHQKGVEFLRRVTEIDPFFPRITHAFLARGYLMLRDYDKAEEELRLCYAHIANNRVCYEVAAVVYAETRQSDKARSAVATLRRLDPTFTLATAPPRLPFAKNSDRDRFLNAFREAGLPE
jgi:adenylate cyclase